MTDPITRKYKSGGVTIEIELFQEDELADTYGCDVRTEEGTYPCSVSPPASLAFPTDSDEAFENVARSALSFASDGADPYGVAEKAEIETVGTGCAVDRWKVEVVPTLTVFAFGSELTEEGWDRVEEGLRRAFPMADLQLELDDLGNDPEVQVEPVSAINEFDVLRVLERLIKEHTP